ncbi:isoprenylcysteine carboxylmethyltransferase family protein [Peteryoungia desertarenae]|uniref:Isoprenylcysteine carboxylmethyltransferase family protein n=1 Tax=Peteryoungia desertarenae TaxID=1813451 RepID=A0ABX6QQ83_9HYPH|nr:protein-S-isoprenylcysteine O-methyltransferase [Peteryoungia desertarenae]QLF70678.1 isoprenylcysteine carboxylmethyltransferase family protein [Peteryoungia desertarenae]
MITASFCIWLVIVLGWVAMRYPAMRRARKQKTKVDNRTPLDISLLILCFLGLFVVPLLWRLDVLGYLGDRGQPLVLIVAGLVTGIAFLWLFRRSHKDLGRNWSVSLEIREDHRLVTGGVYAHVRHPMYASFFLWGLMQLLLIPNWIAGLAGLVSVSLLYIVRQAREEAMMHETFGQEYVHYCARTKRLVPGVY